MTAKEKIERKMKRLRDMLIAEGYFEIDFIVAERGGQLTTRWYRVYNPGTEYTCLCLVNDKFAITQKSAQFTNRLALRASLELTKAIYLIEVLREEIPEAVA